MSLLHTVYPTATSNSSLRFNLSAGSNDTAVTEQLVSVTYQVVVTVVFVLLIVAAALGNSLVVAAVAREKQLNTTANKLVASLAITDLIIGVLVMPLAAAYHITGSWLFGWVTCYMFICLDVICCTSSILHLVAIALDRYWSFTDITYRRGSKKHKYFLPIAITGTWILSTAICLPPFFGWAMPNRDKTCLISQDKIYTVYSTVGAFYLPLTVIIVIYLKIFLVIRRRVRGKQFRPSVRKEGICNSQITDGGIPNSETSTTLETTFSSSPSATQLLDTTTTVQKNGNSEEAICNSSIYSLLKSVPIISHLRKKSGYREKLAARREKRALRTLLIITGIFITCWLPFFVFAVLIPFCGEYCNIPIEAIHFVTWLGYFNSVLNPIIYTIFSPDFRMAFQRLLCSRCPSIIS